jgi:hypothetical protein
MTANIEALRDEVREYLASHPIPQELLAEQMGISFSWLNKFINGQFPNLGVPRFNTLFQWVEKDRADRAGRGLPPIRDRTATAPANTNT